MFSLILAIVLTILIITLALVACFLLIPFTVCLTGTVSLRTPAKLNFSLSWLGLTLWRTKEKRRNAPSPKKEKPSSEKKKGFSLGEGLRMLSIIRDSVPALLILGRSAKKAVSLQNFNVDVSLGLGDPSDTAMVAGYVWSFMWILNAFPPVSIAFSPQFEEETSSFAASLRIKARIQLLFLVGGFLRAYMKKPFRRLIKEVRARRKS